MKITKMEALHLKKIILGIMMLLLVGCQETKAIIENRQIQQSAEDEITYEYNEHYLVVTKKMDSLFHDVQSQLYTWDELTMINYANLNDDDDQKGFYNSGY